MDELGGAGCDRDLTLYNQMTISSVLSNIAFLTRVVRTKNRFIPKKYIYF